MNWWGKIFSPNPIKKLKGEIKFMRERTIKKQFWVKQNEDDLLKAKSKKAGLT